MDTTTKMAANKTYAMGEMMEGRFKQAAESGEAKAQVANDHGKFIVTVKAVEDFSELQQEEE